MHLLQYQLFQLKHFFQSMMSFTPIFRLGTRKINGESKFSEIKVIKKREFIIGNRFKFGKMSRKDLLFMKMQGDGYQGFDHWVEMTNLRMVEALLDI